MLKTKSKLLESILYRITIVVTMLALVFGGQATMVQNVQALSVAVQKKNPTNMLTLHVISARTEPRDIAVSPTGVHKGDNIPAFKWMINLDNAGTNEQRSPNPGTGCSPQDPGYPDSCHWTSIAGVQNGSFSPIYAQGDETDFAATGLNLPEGRYLISVLADGYKLDGTHFTVPLTSDVTVELQPTPLPDATVRTMVFEDNAPTNSSPDMPAENGLGGFQGHITDYLGEVTTDVYGNPLCTTYKGEDPATFVIPNNQLGPDQLPIVDQIGGKCLSLSFGTPAQTLADPYHFTTDPIQVGMLAIPHLGPNRYALSVVGPLGTDWIQTTTLEGNHDWDAWVMEGSTGFDTEFVVAGEPFPATFFGFVHGTPNAYSFVGSGSGEIKGLAMEVKAYIPPTGGIVGETGLLGARIDKPMEKPWISLSDLNNGDATVYVGQGAVDGSFDITGVPDGDYVLGAWDGPQDYIFNFQNVTIKNGEMTDLGSISMLGWWTTISGYVFNDLNGNGKKDAGEPGINNFPIAVKKRENSISDRGAVRVTTDQNGYYFMENAYPITQWLVEEAYVDGYHTTGVTYQADNQPTETTVLGSGVDVNFHPVIGLSGRLDWGVQPYDATGKTCNPIGSYSDCVNPRNGGIVGTVTYDTTRNELDPRYAVTEDWQPGIPGLTVDLFAPAACVSAPCDSTGRYQLDDKGAIVTGKLLNTYLTETWTRPSGCVARDVNNNPLQHGIDENVLPLDPNAPCIEAPMMGVQFGPMETDQGTPAANFGSAVDGNYGFGDACFNGTLDATDPANPVCNGGDFTPLPGGLDYLVKVEIPTDVNGRPAYKVTREEDVNIFHGDQFIPQVPPPACAGPLHVVDVKSVDGIHNLPDGTDTVDNPDFANSVADLDPTVSASPFEGLSKPLCDTKLVHVSNGKSIAPNFNLFTDVPMPTRFWGLMIDDLNFSSNPKSSAYGEKLPVPFAPVGIYDYANRLVDTVETDYNGIFDVLLPSTNRISCPTPSGVCANLYRLVGNDPGTPGHWNANYNQQYRTIAAEFEGFPGLLIPVDLAPTPVSVAVQIPGIQPLSAVACMLDPVTPQLFSVDKPYADVSSGPASLTINGMGFGADQRTGKVTLASTTLPETALQVTSWSDHQIKVTIPANAKPGSHQLSIRSDNGQSTVNGLSFHVLNTGTIPPYPQNGALDTFTRTNGALGSNWSGTIPQALFRVQSGQAQVRSLGGFAYWNAASFGANQEAAYKFGSPLSTTATRQDLLLKMTNPSNLLPGSSYIDVSYNVISHTVTVETVANPQGRITRATFTGITFSAGDKFGVRALADGTVNVYQGSGLIGSTNVTSGPNGWPAAQVSAGGNIGVLFTFQNPFSPNNQANFDDFGGGTLTAGDVYYPFVVEVGPNKNIKTIQGGIDAAASHSQALVVVYPGTVDNSNPRYNGRGAYYENIIINNPVKLQGVGPGGVYPDGTPVQGTIIDGIGFGGDTAIATAWLNKIGTLTWDGNPSVYDGQVIYVLARDGEFTNVYKAAIDGMDIRGGDQMGLPGNLNAIFGGFPGPVQAANVETQGGAIFANAYARNLQITNNMIQNNGGSYGAIRIGTPNLTGQHNENVRIANNRIIANGGTNLAGAVGLFAGSDYYEIAGNDLCGNFSAEYGGGISHFGLSPNGKIHDNRIYFNSSYDEGAGILVAGELPTDPTLLSPGSGPVDIYNNFISSNLADDDGGGIRFLMSGNSPMNVYNNMIVNNISAHEGGGIAIDDAPDVRVFNNTIMKNITTATAITSNGSPAPAGLSTGQNSVMLQATLPLGSASYSNPLLFNNIFWDNRAGTRQTNYVSGIGSPADPNPDVINNWDMGTFDGLALLSPTNSIIQSGNGVLASPTNKFSDPLAFSPYDIGITFASWRTNVNMIGAIMVTADLPPTLMGNYHIPLNSPALDSAATKKADVNAPVDDFDHDGRLASFIDIGADEANGVAGGAAVAFPQTSVLDNFNRANSSSLGANWTSPSTGLRVDNKNAHVRLGALPVFWNTNFGAKQEAYFTFAKAASIADQSLMLKFNGTSGPLASDASFIQVTYNALASPASVSVWTKAPGQGMLLRGTFPVTFASNDIFGARALADGTVRIFKNGIQYGYVDITTGANPWTASLVSSGGRIGTWFVGATNIKDARFDDFGGGTMP